jgi:glyoxylase-like metal-dependent hydrolase (beta-lactamase superfamily II)
MTGPGTNTYLVGIDEVAVIDPGPADADHVDAIVRCASADQIRWILLTHFHPDHAPGADLLRKRTGAEVVAATRRHTPVVVDRAVADGAAIEGSEFRLTAIEAPGHAQHHLCFLLEDERALFTGDTVLDGTTSVITPDGGDMAAYLTTLDRLAALRPRRIYPGHGGVIGDAVDRIEMYAAHRRAREAEVLAYVQAAPQRISELVATIYPELDDALRPVAEWQVHAHLIKLRADGLVDGRDARSIWRAA